MKKSDIKVGMHVITNNGEEYVILKDIYATSQTEKAYTVMVDINGDGWMNFDEYTDDLRFDENLDGYDIKAVFVPKFYCGTLDSVNYGYADYNSYRFEKLWERPIAKKMTKADIEKELGYEIEIIKEN